MMLNWRKQNMIEDHKYTCQERDSQHEIIEISAQIFYIFFLFHIIKTYFISFLSQLLLFFPLFWFIHCVLFVIFNHISAYNCKRSTEYTLPLQFIYTHDILLHTCIEKFRHSILSYLFLDNFLMQGSSN
jgi:hypothetical protein